MEFFTVSLFGHKVINDLRGLHDQLLPILRKLMEENAYVTFLIGRNGEFDEYAASVIKSLKEENGDITLVLPYTVANLIYYEKYYDHIVIPECMYGVHPKAAITARNRWMVECSDLVICYVNHEKGGAYRALKYAEKLNKRVINLCHKGDFDF